MAILDVGCGTGDLAVIAAQAGAFATGIDISEGMLAVAQERVKKNGLENKVVLHHAGVVEIDILFDDKSFDLITSTFVMSGLYADEMRQAGIEITEERYSFLESFVTVVARRSKVAQLAAVAQVMKPDQDRSHIKSLFDFCGRWYPNPVVPGLRRTGSPWPY